MRGGTDLCRRGAQACAAIGLVVLATMVPSSLFVREASAQAQPAKRSPTAPAATRAVELPDRRTATSRTYRNLDGSLTVSLFAGPVNFRDGSGKWRAIASRVVPAVESGYAWRNEANSFNVLFKARAASDFLRLGIGGRPFAFTLEGANATDATVDGNVISYPHVFDGVSLRYDILPVGVKETLVLADASRTTFRFLLTTPAGTSVSARELDDGSWGFYVRSSGEPAFVLRAPYAVDASGDERRAGERASLDVTKDKSGFAVELALDASWLRDPARRFPVAVDPTIEIQPPLVDAKFDAACPTCTAGTVSPDRLRIGTNATEKWRSLLKFDLGDIPAGADVTDARLWLYYSGNCVIPSGGACVPGTHQIDVHRMTSDWSTSSTSASLAFDSTALSSYTLSTIADGDVRWMDWPVTGTVRNWLLGSQPNFGLLAKRNTEPLDASGPAPPSTGYTAEATLKPRLDVTFSGGVQLLPIETWRSNGADLRWTRWDGAPGTFDKYEVHRSPTSRFVPSSATLLTTIRDIEATAFTDTTAKPSATFSYEIVANGQPSNERTVTLTADGKGKKVLTPSPGAGKMTLISAPPGGSSCANSGAVDRHALRVDSSAVSRLLVQFDLRDIPTRSTVTTGRLELWRPFSQQFQVTYDAHRMTTAWTEGAGLGTCTGDGATWVDAHGGVKWTTPGGDYDPVASDGLTNNLGKAAGWDKFGFPGLVQKWINGEVPNHGVLIKMRNETPVEDRPYTPYYSDEHDDRADATSPSDRHL